MKARRVLCLALLAGSAARADALPAEVQAFLERRALCEHFSAEPWPEGESAEARERRDFLAQGFERYCRGTDAELSRLRQAYPAARAVLAPFEDRMETHAD